MPLLIALPTYFARGCALPTPRGSARAKACTVTFHQQEGHGSSSCQGFLGVSFAATTNRRNLPRPRGHCAWDCTHRKLRMNEDVSKADVLYCALQKTQMERAERPPSRAHVDLLRNFVSSASRPSPLCLTNLTLLAGLPRPFDVSHPANVSPSCTIRIWGRYCCWAAARQAAKFPPHACFPTVPRFTPLYATRSSLFDFPHLLPSPFSNGQLQLVRDGRTRSSRQRFLCGNPHDQYAPFPSVSRQFSMFHRIRKGSGGKY